VLTKPIAAFGSTLLIGLDAREITAWRSGCHPVDAAGCFVDAETASPALAATGRNA
jgi:hypothetical protein